MQTINLSLMFPLIHGKPSPSLAFHWGLALLNCCIIFSEEEIFRNRFGEAVVDRYNNKEEEEEDDCTVRCCICWIISIATVLSLINQRNW